MEKLFLMIVAGAAVVCDLWKGKIPNLLVASGMGIACWFQITGFGITGFWSFLGGSMLPLFLLAVLFYFRMLGAGDIKLFCVIGGFLGIEDLLSCMAVSFLMGAVVSLALLIKGRSLKRRLSYFFAYIGRFYQTGKRVPYRDSREKEAEFCFAVPIFLSVMLYIGGIY